MAAPNVTISEVSLSTRVPRFPGVYCGIIIPAKKGEVGVPHLMTSESQFLKDYTPDEKIKVGYDLSHYSAIAALAKTNKLWVVRAANSALYGGLIVKSSGAISDNAAVSGGISDPEAYTFDNSSSDEDALLFYGKNQGAWNNSISIKVITYENDPDTVKEPDSFIVEVYKSDNLNDPIETPILCSRIAGKKDGFNRGIYVEDALNASDYVGAIDNVVLEESVYPKEQTTTLAMAQGDDGAAVVDAQMLSSLTTLANKKDKMVTLFLDGGWATVAYQKQGIIATCESRKDCYGILSVPYSEEASSNYLNDVIAYRRTTLNASTSYAGLNTPHPYIYDKFNDRYVYVPPDGYVAAIISETASNREIWYAAAGPRRGQLNVIDLKRRYTDGEMDAIYDAGINPIQFAPGKGIRRWGQKTLLSRPAALDRENVRLMLIVIEPAIAEALEDFIFEFNDAPTRSMITVMIDAYMAGIKARRGVYEYEVKCNEENNTSVVIDNNELNVWLFVKPTKVAEFIKFVTIVTSSGMSFQLAEQSL